MNSGLCGGLKFVSNLLIRSIEQNSRAKLRNYSSTTCIRSLTELDQAKTFETIDMESQNKSDQSLPRNVFVQHNDKGFLIISFKFNTGDKIRSFNLSRKSTEPLQVALERIRLNLLKVSKHHESNDSEGQYKNCVVDILINGSRVDPQSVLNHQAWVEGAELLLNGQAYRIVENHPQVESLSLPNCMMKGFHVVPQVSLKNCTLDECKFDWYRRITSQKRQKMIEEGMDPNRITLVDNSYYYYLGNGSIYIPTEDDVANYLRVVCWPSDGQKLGLEVARISSQPVEVGPEDCPFEKRHALTPGFLTDPGEFRIISYNILADLYADQDYSREVLFAHCSPFALEIDYRRTLLLKEISGYKADLICLQEVDAKEFKRTYEPFFKLNGCYSGVFDSKGGFVAEGEATFYRDEKFELVENHRTILSELIEPISLKSSKKEESSKPEHADKEQSVDESESVGLSNSDHIILKDRSCLEAQHLLSKFDTIRNVILSNEKLRRRFVDRHTVLQSTLLRMKQSPRQFLAVFNTHLYFAPDADHIRLLQGSVCVKYMESMKQYYTDLLKTKYQIMEPKISLVFCGDMNSTPDCGLYKLVQEGKVSRDLPDWSSNEEEAVKDLDVETNLRFCPAYKDLDYTNFTPGFSGCLDYIYYEAGNLGCKSTVPLPDHEDVTATGGIPSEVFPSDHLALIANLEIGNDSV